MKWIGISGSWRKTDKQIERDVRRVVRKIISAGEGIVTGGALGVDYFAIDEAFKLNPTCKQIKIILPTPLKLYSNHYRKKAKDKVITHQQAEDLITQLNKIKQTNPDSLVEMDNSIVDKETYYARNTKIVEAADKLIAFHVNQSTGTQNAIDKACQKGISVKINSYTVN